VSRQATEPDWSRLRHAYGPATDVPDLLDRASRDAEDRNWTHVWSCLCHQGTVYSASYAALPRLFEIVRERSSPQRAHPLVLIGAIIASDSLFGINERREDIINPLLPQLRRIAQETLVDDRLDQVAFIHVLQAACAFHDDLFWGRHLGMLGDGEFPGRCTTCHREVRLAIGQYGFFATAEEWIRKPGVKKTAIAPVEPSALQGRGMWLYDQATSSRRTEVADWIRHLFGTTKCPACEVPISVEDAISSRLDRR
jgi:hypothetical protein